MILDTGFPASSRQLQLTRAYGRTFQSHLYRCCDLVVFQASAGYTRQAPDPRAASAQYGDQLKNTPRPGTRYSPGRGAWF